jgi:hypothetical protein
VKYLAIILAMVASLAHADPTWKVPEPAMSKGPPSELDKAIAKLPLAKLPAKQPAKKKAKQKPGVSIGMTRYDVRNNSDWGKPSVTKRIINGDGTWDIWTYNGIGVLTFLDDELFEIELNEQTCN